MIDITKYEDIEDFSMSEEMLGAYLEGNLHGSEFREVQNFIHDNASVSSLIDIVESDIDFIDDLDLSYQQSIVDSFGTEDLLSEISLPVISAFEMDSLIDPSASLTEDIILGGECHDFIGDDGHLFYLDDQDNNNNHNDTELDFGVSDNIDNL